MIGSSCRLELDRQPADPPDAGEHAPALRAGRGRPDHAPGDQVQSFGELRAGDEMAEAHMSAHGEGGMGSALLAIRAEEMRVLGDRRVLTENAPWKHQD